MWGYVSKNSCNVTFFKRPQIPRRRVWWCSRSAPCALLEQLLLKHDFFQVQASLAANTFAVTGHGENKQITELLPGILNQLGAESLTHLKKLASTVGAAEENAKDAEGEGADADDEDDVPDLVENFDEASKDEKKTDGKCKKVVMLTSRFLPSPSFRTVLPSPSLNPENIKYFSQRIATDLHQYFPQPLKEML